MQIHHLKTSDVRPYEKNPRKNDEAVDVVAKSLEEFGFQQPLVLDADNVIVVGHTRFRAAKKLGLETVPCLVAGGLTDEQINAYRIMDNKSAEYASWHDGLLVQEMTSLLEANYDLELTGFSNIELKDMGLDVDLGFVDEGFTDEDDVPDLPDEPVTKLGDVWQLGSHRLMCGDSTSIDDVGTLMDGQKADMVFTDPPWNVNYGGAYKARKILNDHMKPEQWQDFVSGFAASLRHVSKGGCMTYVVMSAQEWGVLDKTLREHGFHWSSSVIWKKDRLVLSRKDYHTQYEPIWYGWNDASSRLVPLIDRKQSDVWEFNRPRVSELPPTTKPVELIEKAIQNSSHRSNLILDLFLGSGSTLIAAERTGRRCYGMELDPKYCDVIVKRWENFTKKTAELQIVAENGERIREAHG